MLIICFTLTSETTDFLPDEAYVKQLLICKLQCSKFFSFHFL